MSKVAYVLGTHEVINVLGLQSFVIIRITSSHRGFMSKTRTIRLNEEDEKLIDEFLQKNSILDFSTLARIAIKQFIQSPSITLKSVSNHVRGAGKDRLKGNKDAESRF